MSLLINVLGKQLLSGLSWREIHDPTNAREEVANYAREVSARYCVKLDGARGSFVGLTRADDGDKDLRARGAYSVAALFATMPKVAGISLLFIDLPPSGEGQRTIVVGVRNGLPQPGFDASGDRKSMMELANEFMQLSSSGVTIYTNTRAFQGAYPLDLEDLIHTDAKLARVRRYSPSSGKVITLAILAVTVLGAGVGYYLWEEHKAAEARKAAAQRDPNVLYQRALPAALNSVSPRPSAIGAQVLPVVGKTPASAAGWKVATIDCKATFCVTKWGAGVGTNKSFSETFPDAKPEYDLNGTWLSVSTPLELTSPPLNPATLPTLKSFLFETGSKFQLWSKAGLQYRLSELSVFALPPGVPPEAIRNPVMAGDWEASGAYWMLPSALAGLPDNMSVDQVVLSQSIGQVTFSIKGKFHVQP